MSRVVYLRDEKKVPVGCVAWNAKHLGDGEFEVDLGYSVVHERDYSSTLGGKVGELLDRLNQAVHSDDRYSAAKMAEEIAKTASARNCTPARSDSRRIAVNRLAAKPMRIRFSGTRSKDSKDGKVLFREDLLMRVATDDTLQVPDRLRSLCRDHVEYLQSLEPKSK